MGHAGAIVSRRAGHRRVQGRGARGGRLPGRRLPDRAARAAPRRPATAAEGDGTPRVLQAATSATLFDYDRWATRRVLSVIDGLPRVRVRVRPGVIGEPRAGAPSSSTTSAPTSAGGTGCRAATSTGRVPEREPLPSPAALAEALGHEWDDLDAWLDDARPTPGVAEPRRERRLLADAGPRREPRHPAPVRGGDAPDRGRPIARRPRHDRLRRASSPVEG